MSCRSPMLRARRSIRVTSGRRLRTNVRFRIETTGPACLVSAISLV
jgi:hypothetical protein